MLNILTKLSIYSFNWILKTNSIIYFKVDSSSILLLDNILYIKLTNMPLSNVDVNNTFLEKGMKWLKYIFLQQYYSSIEYLSVQ